MFLFWALDFKKDTDSVEHVQRAGGQTGGCSGKDVTGGQGFQAFSMGSRVLGRLDSLKEGLGLCLRTVDFSS
jgi:hypothetical protein